MDEITALAGSLLCVGIGGAILAQSERAALERLRPAGIILFARNVTTLEATCALVRDARDAIGGDVPAYACVDQEGGRVRRLAFAPDAMPAMLALGATDDLALARRTGARLAHEVRAVGANVNLAPVLDVLSPHGHPVIGTRSLGTDPALVARMGAELIAGMQAAGVAATAKHFPGYGSAASDAHVALPHVDLDRDTLGARDLAPFRAAIAGGVKAIMTAHVVVPALDGHAPATLSPRILRDLLRGDLGFEGVCITDCLEMDAIAGSAGSVRGAESALAAGADVALVSHDLALAGAARDAIVASVRAGRLPEARVREAAARVAALRAWCAPAADPSDTAPEPIANEIARRAVRRVRGDARVGVERPVTVISFEGDDSDGIARTSAERPSLALALRRRRVRAESMRVPLDPDRDTIESLVEIVRAHGARDVVIVVRRAYRIEGQRRALDALLASVPHAIAVAALEPYDVDVCAAAATVVSTSGDDEHAVDALADALVETRVA